MFFIQRLLQQAGYDSEIYCHNIDERVSRRIRPLSEFVGRKQDLLLFHYSLGTPHDHWISELKCPIILIYHNITPNVFFPPGSDLFRLCRSGRAQLEWWGPSRLFVGAVGDSEFNGGELVSYGYPLVASIGLLVDLDMIKAKVRNSPTRGSAALCKSVLFVGNFIEHKGQFDLVQMFSELTKICDTPVELILAGGSPSLAYRESVEAEVVRLGLSTTVRLLGKQSYDDLYALYRSADLYVSLSEHEGFGMPLVEAMAFDVPVLAYPAGSVSATLNGGGEIIESRDPFEIAVQAKRLLEEPALRSAVIRRQRKALASYESPVLAKAFESFLGHCGFDVDILQGRPESPASEPPTWTIEGPFDSAYSLAIVNRELARALCASGERVSLISRDGEAHFSPDTDFLASNPDIAAVWRAPALDKMPDVVLRNQYPPHVSEMKGVVRGLANFAWEESGFPANHVREFNATLNLITVTSRFVAKVLRDNGVHTPICVVGNGVNHLAKATDAPARVEEFFEFLHVSSGFPRKGIDALLEAWARAFGPEDKVRLTIKTISNPHNDVSAQLERFRKMHPGHAAIDLIEGEVDAGAMQDLYLNADVIVCPSRGEGFGLPLAEALALGRPVITTAYGGQLDFCRPETAWLCDYSFKRAETHLGVTDSVWAEPDVGSLASLLAVSRESSHTDRARRALKGQELIFRDFTWERVARRTIEAVNDVANPLRGVPRLPRIGWISTWNSRCGIAAYAASLACGLEADRLCVFANRTDDLIGDDGPRVRRCWSQGFDDPLDELYDEIIKECVEVAVLQFNFGFYRLDYFARLLERLHSAGIIVLVVLHSTADVERSDITIRLATAKTALSNCQRLLVHSIHDLNRLKSIGLIENVALFPQGMGAAFAGDREKERRALGLSDRLVIATFGFLLPHKGLRQLVEAFTILRSRFPNAHLLMLNAIYPAHESQAECEAVREAIAASDMDAHVTLTTSFLNEADIVARLAASDVVVFPYQHTQESGSAAIKLGLASLSPVACTPLPIFEDGAAMIHRLPGITPSAIAAGLTDILSDKSEFEERRQRQKIWAAAHAWPQISYRLDGLIRGLHFDASNPGQFARA
jgi:glycosyltransferase involved in cell wall biosynthesis